MNGFREAMARIALRADETRIEKALAIARATMERRGWGRSVRSLDATERVFKQEAHLDVARRDRP